MKSFIDRLLQITVVSGGLFLGLSGVSVNREADQYMTTTTKTDSERNENSTPRSFILPATPGVAFEQERQKSDKAKLMQVAKCLVVLRHLGFEVEDIGTMLNAKLVEAIYTFQVEQGLPASGRLDEATMRKLKCL